VPWQPLRRAALAAALCLAAAACGGQAHGAALGNSYNQQLGLAPIRTGTEIGVLYTLLYNHSHTPLTIDAITLAGKGLGTVVRPARTQIADGGPGSSVPQTVYAENPPLAKTTSGCVTEALRPVTGYRLKPGHYIAVWTIILGTRPGRFNLNNHLITYTQDSHRYQEVITQGFHGTVTRHAPLLTTAGDGSGGCWRHSHSHLLKGVPW
jgi:hypothetical protein